MCGIFGIISNKPVIKSEINSLAADAERRGKDSSGLYFYQHKQYKLFRASLPLTDLLCKTSLNDTNFLIGHSRLITNGLQDNQPVYLDDICVIHNGIVINDKQLWKKSKRSRKLEIDTEIIAAIVADALDSGVAIENIAEQILNLCKGTVSCAIALPKLGKLFLYSNNGSLFFARKDNSYYFASERFSLSKLGCLAIQQICQHYILLNIPRSKVKPNIQQYVNRSNNLIPSLQKSIKEEKLLEYKSPKFRRCSRCILPETMPFISFDKNGVCNYCNNYKPRNKPRPVEEIFRLLDPYRRIEGNDCIIPLSGGRDSCYGLHLAIKELKLKPITYTYDWGMVTDLGRRNISRMCSQLNIENIIIADDISLKRNNIRKNFIAWLKHPDLGMVSILTAGDKHFFRHIEAIKRETEINLNLWSINPLEVTHFKSGFLGVAPDFEENRVYSRGGFKQLHYQWMRLCAMGHSLGYFNSSLWDTLLGEYYRSFYKKSDYFHIYDYWKWDEILINKVLLNEYDWEISPDTNTTWRIGDGTAAIYNYIYYTIAGFSEHDTFRSNQIREGEISREDALALVQDENRPRYPNIKWYLDAIGMNFDEVIRVINNVPKLFNPDIK